MKPILESIKIIDSNIEIKQIGTDIIIIIEKLDIITDLLINRVDSLKTHGTVIKEKIIKLNKKIKQLEKQMDSLGRIT